jgi:hypothetical protein
MCRDQMLERFTISFKRLAEFYGLATALGASTIKLFMVAIDKLMG